MRSRVLVAKALLVQVETLKHTPIEESGTIGTTTLLALTLRDAESLAQEVLAHTTVLARAQASVARSLALLHKPENRRRWE